MFRKVAHWKYTYFTPQMGVESSNEFKQLPLVDEQHEIFYHNLFKKMKGKRKHDCIEFQDLEVMKGKKKIPYEVLPAFEYVYVEHFNCGKNLDPLDYDSFKKMMETLVKEQQQSVKDLEDADETPVFNQWAAEI